MGQLVAGRYRLLAELGSGGMGVVFRAEDQATGTELALKRLYPGADGDASDQLRFRREFHTLAGLRHPRIVEVYDYGVDDLGPFYTMQLLDGADLRDLGRQPPERACAILRDVASALAFLHARRLIHRDVSPRNVRLTGDDAAKLIDFGVLATFGISGEVAGTPPLVAPECVRGVPIDHRTDLYALGGLAYWLIAGRHAYPARGLTDLPRVWRDRPPPLSAASDDVPVALEELVTSLLSHDPLARPASAAEVIDRLGAIAGLPPLTEVETSHGYLASANMVGRKPQLAKLRDRLFQATGGHGAAILVEGPSGNGKSRLLRELGLHAKIAGTAVVNAHGSAARGGYGVVREIARELMASAPDDVAGAAGDGAATLARLLPELRARLDVAPRGLSADPAEDRLRGQEAIARWLLEIAGRRPLVLLIDDLQRCDEPSAAVLAALAHSAAESPLLIVASVRTDEPVRAPAAAAAIRLVADRMRLRGLDAAELEELIRSLFGDIPNAGRLARWMHQLGGGNPLHSTELARHLIDRGVIRFADGAWTATEAFAQQSMPGRLQDAMDVRVAALPAPARELGQVLGVLGGEFSLDLCVALVGAEREQEVFGGLDVLVGEDVLVGAGGRYQFRHDGLREALERSLAEDARRDVHLRVATALSALGDPDRDGEIGWHLYHGGRERDAAELLERAGRQLYEAQSLAEAIAPLQTALDIQARQGAPPHRLIAIRRLLVMCGVFSDRAVALTHLEAVTEDVWHYSGLALAQRIARFLGRPLALVVALVVMAVRRWFTPARRRGPRPIEALTISFEIFGTTATIYSHLHLHAELRKVIDRTEILATFRSRAPSAAWLFARSLLGMIDGNRTLCLEPARLAGDILRRDRLTPVGDFARRAGQSLAHGMQAWFAVTEMMPDRTGALAGIEALEVKGFAIGVHYLRGMLHRNRGEEDAARAALADAEHLKLQLGPQWTWDGAVAWTSVFGYSWARDVGGLRRTIDDVGRLIGEGYKLEHVLALARGDYHRERGDLARAREELEHAIARDQIRGFTQWLYAPLAETLLAQGDAAGAAAIARAGHARALDPDTGRLVCRLRCERALALAEAASGDSDAAAARLDAAIATAADLASPLVSGSLHEARARVAHQAGDRAGFDEHARHAASWFGPTQNPPLLARIEALAALDAAPGAPVSTADEALTTSVEVDDDTEHIRAAVASCCGPRERASWIAAHIAQEARADNAYLFLRDGPRIRFAAPDHGREPPDDVEALARDAIERGRSPDPRVVMLALPLERPIIVGAVAVIGAAPRPVDPAVAAAIAVALHDSGDVTVTAPTTRMSPG